MNSVWCLISIGFMVLISKSNASSDSPDGELLQTLLDTVIDLNSRVDTIESESTALQNQVSNASAAIMELNTEINTLREQLEETSIISPFTGVNFAICSGRLAGISGVPGDTDRDDLRCPPGSEEREGPNGEIRGPSANLLNVRTDTASIDECEAICEETPNCVAFDWIVDTADFVCELYSVDVPAMVLPSEIIIFCALRTEERVCEIGEIIAWSGLAEDLPGIYLLANGSTIDGEVDYPDLCDIIAGVCGNPLFCTLPDLVGRFPVGAGSIDSDEVMTDLCVEGAETTLILSAE